MQFPGSYPYDKEDGMLSEREEMLKQETDGEMVVSKKEDDEFEQESEDPAVKKGIEADTKRNKNQKAKKLQLKIIKLLNQLQKKNEKNRFKKLRCRKGKCVKPNRKPNEKGKETSKKGKGGENRQEKTGNGNARKQQQQTTSKPKEGDVISSGTPGPPSYRYELPGK
ncbi:hypothetical protein AC249_AIPGENE28 [Exaiptasia diaphana]|nr:hypothetical protein AC249_AIPGENE28 [Exaiptasia diaphana]